MVTSPPYNVGMEYEDKMSLKEYLYFLSDVWLKACQKLIPGGRFAINIANTGRNPYVPLANYITQQLLQMGMVAEGEIIWLKPVASQKSNSSFGSWRMPSNPSLADRHEYILIFRKDERRRNISEIPENIKKGSRLSKEDFLKYRCSTWDINTAPKNGHPCPFPQELSKRLISLYSFIGDIVLDPFMGSGTTALTARHLRRNCIGYEIKEQYYQLSQQKLNNS